MGVSCYILDESDMLDSALHSTSGIKFPLGLRCRQTLMLANTDAGRHWCWQTLMLANTDAGRHWCWQTLMLADTDAGRHWCWQTLMLADTDAGRHWCWQTLMLADTDAGKHWCWQTLMLADTEICMEEDSTLFPPCWGALGGVVGYLERYAVKLNSLGVGEGFTQIKGYCVTIRSHFTISWIPFSNLDFIDLSLSWQNLLQVKTKSQHL